MARMRDRLTGRVPSQASPEQAERAAVRARALEIETRLAPVLALRGVHIVLQPVVELAGGRRVGAEALARFPESWHRTPDVVLAEADEVGLRADTEVLAIERAVELLPLVDGFVSLNVSPQTLLTPQGWAMLAALPPERVWLEIRDVEPGQQDAALAERLDGPRSRGLRVAVDGVGLGTPAEALRLAPDLIKLDRSIVSGVADDLLLTRRVAAYVEAAHATHALVAAVGVESEPDAARLAGLGVDLAQGWLFGAPCVAQALTPLAPPVLPQQRRRDLR